MTDSVLEWFGHQGECDALVYSVDADRLFCMAAGWEEDLSAVRGSGRGPCWAISGTFEGPRDICMDTSRGKLYCGSWPMGVSIIDMAERVVTANPATASSYGYAVSGCVNALLGKCYILDDAGGILVLDAVADTAVARIRLHSTLAWSLSACAAEAGRVLCMAREPDTGVLIDCAADTVVGGFTLGHPVSAIQVSPDGMAFLIATAGYLYVVDARTATVLGSLSIGAEPPALCCASNLGKLYCADRSRGQLWVVTASGDSMIGRIELDNFPEALCYDPADSKLYVTCAWHEAIYVVDCAHDSIVARIDLAGSRPPSAPAYSSYGNRVYFVSGDSLGAIDCSGDSIATWVRHRWYDPCPPRVFPSLHLVSVTHGGQFITLFSDPAARQSVVASAAPATRPTVSCGMLRLAGPGPGCLFDLGGRKVLDLLPGPNDLGGLTPGVYFAREQTAGGSGSMTTRKVVLLR